MGRSERKYVKEGWERVGKQGVTIPIAVKKSS